MTAPPEPPAPAPAADREPAGAASGPAAHRIHAVFPGTPDQIAAARRWLSAWLGPDHPAADTAVLLLSETFANSCAHSASARPGGVIEVAAELTAHTVHLDITDAGGAPSPTAASTSTSPSPSDLAEPE